MSKSKAFFIATICVAFIYFAIVGRYLYVKEKNITILTESAFSAINNEIESMSDFDQDYLMQYVGGCLRASSYYFFYDYNTIEKLTRKSPLISAEAMNIKGSCVRNFILEAPSYQEALSRNAKLAEHAIAPYTTSELSRILSVDTTGKYASSADIVSTGSGGSEI